MFKRIAKSFVVGRTVSALSQLDDKTLADIGIERCDIRAHAEKING